MISLLVAAWGAKSKLTHKVLVRRKAERVTVVAESSREWHEDEGVESSTSKGRFEGAFTKTSEVREKRCVVGEGGGGEGVSTRRESGSGNKCGQCRIPLRLWRPEHEISAVVHDKGFHSPSAVRNAYFSTDA